MSRMKVVVVHNYYQQPGGEDEVFAAESQLLERNGHEVHRFVLRNDGLEGLNRLVLARDTIWNHSSYQSLRALVQRLRPDVVHFHNTLPRISPSAYYAVGHQGIPVVQTVHNYRLVCPNGLLFRNGAPCHECVGHALALPAIAHRCYRGSRSASAVVAGMTATHRLFGTFRKRVTLYVALTEFARRQLIEGGVPAERIVVKPNFVDVDPGTGNGSGRYALFVGRLSPEKGIRTLLDAWRSLATELPLRIVGDGPLADDVREAERATPGIEWMGRQNRAEVARLMGEATLLICPSVWYEGFGLVVIESFASGTPVIASRLGALAGLGA